ncbi:RebB family R body protein [Aphanothece sacrum]|uniref:RebB family R body protein n=1 Tax=Aphanothece sacrum TaxID=1122 RepID=UPI0034CE75A6
MRLLKPMSRYWVRPPAQSMGMVYQTMAHSLSLSMQNAVTAQTGMQQLNAAIISTACQKILSLTDKT